MRDVKATEEGRIVQRRIEAMIPMKITAFLGCPFLSTLPIQLDPGRIPSRAIANTRRDAAVIARLVFWGGESSEFRANEARIDTDGNSR